MNSEEQQSDHILNRQTGITIGLAIMVLGAAVSAAWWFGQWTGRDSAWKSETDKRLMKIEDAVVNSTKDRWTAQDMIRWTERLRESNPEIQVPQPYHKL